MSATNHRILLGLVLPVFIVGGLLALFGGMGYYERAKHKARTADAHDALAKVEAEVSNGDNIEKVRRIPVLFAERVQPLDSMARQQIRSLTGKRELYGIDPVVMFLSMAWDGEDVWKKIPIFIVSFGANKSKEVFDIESVEKYATIEHVKTDKNRQRALDLHDKYTGRMGEMPRADLEFYNTYFKAFSFAGGFEEAFKFVPPTEAQRRSETTAQNDWHVPARALELGHDPKRAAELQKAFADLKTAWKARDKAGIGAAAETLTASIVALDPEDIPSKEAIESELAYNRTSPFNRASWFLIAASLVGLFAWSFRKDSLRWLSYLLTATGVAFGLWGFYLRTTLGFGVSITNLYESMLAMATATALLCLVIDLVRKSLWATIAGGIGAFVVFLLLDTYPEKFDPKIGGLVAVLANNFWIHIHVPVVMSSYAAFFIAFLLGIVLIPWTFVDPQGKHPELKAILRTSEIALYLGTLLIFVGMILGGLWAHDSWNRFWGWDPKETWSFILFCYYLILIHGRFTKWMNAFWYSLFLFTGGNFLLWTYYGTNELLSGLHSYANSAGDAGFWDNFIHERNRWFVITSGVMALMSIGGALSFFLFGKKRSPDLTPEAF
ncbi:MAG: cytochrome c biogenesis protein CcsA [Planctomycetota bacterium]